MCLLLLSDLIQVKLRSRTTVFPKPTAIIKELELGKHQNTLIQKLGQDWELQKHTIRPTEKQGNVQPPGGILGSIHPLKSGAKVKHNTSGKKKQALILQFVAGQSMHTKKKAQLHYFIFIP